QRRESSASSRGKHLEPPALLLTHVPGRNVEQERDTTGALELHCHRLFDGARAARAVHVRDNPYRFLKVREPEREVGQGRAVVMKRATAGFRATVTPSLGRTLEVIRARADS